MSHERKFYKYNKKLQHLHFDWMKIKEKYFIDIISLFSKYFLAQSLCEGKGCWQADSYNQWNSRDRGELLEGAASNDRGMYLYQTTKFIYSMSNL